MRTCPPTSIVGRTLGELVRRGVIELHVPTLVERETASGLAFGWERIGRELRDAAQWLVEPERLHVTAAIGAIDELFRARESVLKKGVADWLGQLSVNRTEATAEDAGAAFDAYFQGAPPFAARKKRDDLPDAFVFAAFRRLFCLDQRARALVADGRLATACRGLGAQVHESARAFFADPAVVDHAGESEMTNVCRARTDLAARVATEAIEYTLNGFNLHDESFPSDDCVATISGTGTVVDLAVDFSEAETAHYSSYLLVPFTFAASETMIDLLVHRADFWALEHEDRYSVADAEWNEHYVRVQDYVDLRLSGDVAFAFKREGDRLLLEGAQLESLSVVVNRDRSSRRFPTPPFARFGSTPPCRVAP